MTVLRQSIALLAALAPCLSAPAAAQGARPAVRPAPSTTPTAALLAGITARGRAMARFQSAAMMASRALLSTQPDTARVRQYVVRLTAAGWAVHFGRLDAARDTFYEAYVVTPGVSDSVLTIQQREPGRVGAEVDRAAAAAGLLAQEAFGKPSRPYNTFVIPAERGAWWVYLLPAQIEPELYPHGGDVRYRVSADGRRILETRRMHADIVDVRMAEGATGHAHGPARDEVPEDSDVYFVLTRRPRAPELIETAHYDYRVETDGSIRYVPHQKAGTAGDRAGRG